MRFLSLFILALCSLASFAQRPGGNPEEMKGMIMGRVLNEGGSPVPYANVALYSSDSSLIDGTSTNENGGYTIKANPGDYYILISFLSYEEKIIPNLKKEAGKSLKAGQIQLK